MSLGHIALLLTLTVFTAIIGEQLVFRDCGSKSGNLLSVDVSPCPKQPCPLVKGRNYTVNVTFISREATPYCNALVSGEFIVVVIPLFLPEVDGCKSGVVCPLKKGATYNYVTQFPIKAEYPNLKITIAWSLRDAKYKNLFCWKIPFKIVND